MRELDGELAYIAGVILGDGYLSSDGYYVSATFDDEQYMKAFINAVEKYLPNSRPVVRDNGTSKTVTFGSRIFAEMLSRIFSIPRGKKSEKWTVPDAVLHSRESIRYFLAGLFDADATWMKGGVLP